GRLTRLLLATFAQLYRERGGDGRTRHRCPQVLFLMLGFAILRSANEQVNPARAFEQEQIIDIGFAVAHADEVGSRTVRARRTDCLQTAQPFLALLLVNRTLLVV